MVPPAGFEPTLPAPETGALSIELRGLRMRKAAIFISSFSMSSLISNQFARCPVAAMNNPQKCQYGVN